LRKEYDAGRYLIIYEHYKRPPNAVNRFATMLIEERLGHRLHMFSAGRVGAAICIEKDDFAVCATCTIYVRKYISGLCVGREECIKTLADHLSIPTLLLPFRPSFQCKRLGELRSHRHTLYLCFYI